MGSFSVLAGQASCQGESVVPTDCVAGSAYIP